MGRANNIDIYAGDKAHIEVKMEGKTVLTFGDLNVRLVAFDMVWAQMPDGTDIFIYLNEAAPKDLSN